ncbi:MAG: alpha-amylase [Gemmatimonadetes bacterium]|nr:MAG: alpha-amylase [Gemmatimonadota bacterium]
MSAVGPSRTSGPQLRRLGGGAALLTAALAAAAAGQSPSGPAWTRGAVCYEIFVRSFFDSDGDGIGDLNGLIRKLGYVDSLGASCIWLMPVAQSPSYHGYDVSDYYRVAPAYGTNADFKRLVAEAHRRRIKVLVDMVLNHTSNENPWFQAALKDTTSPYRSWYRFSPTALGKGPWGAEAWHHSPVRDEYYYGVFWSGMPDLNYETPAVQQQAMKIATFWLREMGVDGFRLDAVPYLLEEGSCLAGCPGTHAFLRAYAAHIRGPPYRWSPFLSNHDQTRTMTTLGGDVACAKLAATLLLTLPGLPFVYYGEEIGMTGDKPDERLRTPMQWSPRPGVGFTNGTPWEAAQPDSMTVNVALEHSDPVSLLNLYRRLIHLRKENGALGTGTLVALDASSSRVAAYLRRTGAQAVLVVANLSDSAVSGVSIGSTGQSVLRAGTYAARNLLGGPDGAMLAVGPDGRLTGYVPVPGPIGSRESLVLDLVRR